MEIIKFKRNGRIVEARVLSRDVDPTVAVWVVDVNNPDQDYMVQPAELVKAD